jgi:hypothetical protein
MTDTEACQRQTSAIIRCAAQLRESDPSSCAELKRRIDTAVNERQDQAIWDAIRAFDPDDPLAHIIAWTAAETAEINQYKSTDGQAVASTLVALNVWVERPAVLPQLAPCSTIIEQLRAHGIVPDKAHIQMAPHWYHHSDLAALDCVDARPINRAISAATDRRQLTPAALGIPQNNARAAEHTLVHDAGDARAGLRFVIATITAPPDEPPIRTGSPQGGSPYDDDCSRREDEWNLDLQQSLRGAYTDLALSAQRPLMLTPAMAVGVRWYSTTIADYVQQQPMFAHAIKLDLEVETGRRFATVSMLADDPEQPSEFRLEWHDGGAPKSALETIVSKLRCERPSAAIDGDWADRDADRQPAPAPRDDFDRMLQALAADANTGERPNAAIEREVDQLISAGADPILVNAMRNRGEPIDSVDTDEATKRLACELERGAERMEVDLDDASQLESYLIVVPVWIEAPRSMPVAVTDTAPIAQSMISGGHMPRGTTFRLSPALYTAHELLLGHLHEARVLNSAIVRHGDIEPLIARNRVDRVNECREGGGLRFLVGVLLHERHANPDAQTWLLSISEPQQWSAFKAWQAPVLEVVNQQLPTHSRAAWVRPPGPYLRAIASAQEALDLEERAEADETE